MSCPIAFRELFLLPDGQRRLFNGIEKTDTPVSESTSAFEVSSTSRHERDVFAVPVSLSAGRTLRARLRFANGRVYPVENRNLNLNDLVVRDVEGAIVDHVQLESLPRIRCGRPRDDEYHLGYRCPLEVPVTIPADGVYAVEVSVWQEAAGGETARLLIGGNSFEVTSESRASPDKVISNVSLAAGPQTLTLQFENDYKKLEALLLDRMVVRDGGGEPVTTIEFESLDVDCGYIRRQSGEVEIQSWHADCLIGVSFAIPSAGNYSVEVEASQLLGYSPPALLEMTLESHGPNSRGASLIRHKLVDLHQKLLGVDVALDSEEVETAFQLFLDVWSRKHQTQDSNDFFRGQRCELTQDHLLFQGVADELLEIDERGDSSLDWQRVKEFIWQSGRVDRTDRFSVARTWIVVLAYLLTDYRYLYL